MILVSFIMLILTIIVWMLLFAFKDGDKDKKRLVEYAEGTVVGYEDGGRYTGLTVRFLWNGSNVCCGSEQVDRFEFPEDSQVSIYYHPDIMKRPTFSNNDRISGIVHINNPKYKELKKKSHRRTMMVTSVLATFLTLLTITFFLVGILK